MERLQPNSEVEFVTDNLNVYNTYAGGQSAAVNSANCDIYKQMHEQIYFKQLSIVVRWMPSHLGHAEHDDRPEGVSHFDVLANHQADSYAGIAAVQAQIPDPVAVNYIYYVDLVAKTRRDWQSFFLICLTGLLRKMRRHLQSRE